MAFDPKEKISYPSGIFPENPCLKSNISTMISKQKSSILSPTPSHSTAFLYKNNCHLFQKYPLFGANRHCDFSMEAFSSTSPFRMIPTPSLSNSFEATHSNVSVEDFGNTCDSLSYAPNDNKMEAFYGDFNDGRSHRVFSQKNFLHYGSMSQPRVGHSLPPLLVYDAHESMSVNPKLRDGLLDIDGAINYHQGTNGGDQNKHSGIQGNIEIPATDDNIVKGRWTKDEDRSLIYLVNRFGLQNWSKISKLMSGRIGKQCRDRWLNHLQPNIKKGPWSEEEDKVLIEAHKKVGNKWAKIAKRLPGRSENTIKNRWNTIKRALNAKTKKNMHNDGSKGTLLSNYISETTTREKAEKEMKQSMGVMNIVSERNCNKKDLDLIHDRHESSNDNFNFEGWTPQDVEIGDFLSTMFRGDKMISEFGTLNYEFGIRMMPNVPK